MSIGFNPQSPPRRPVFAVSGQKLGYVQGNQVLGVNGRTITKIIRFKPDRDPRSSVSACGGTVVGGQLVWGLGKRPNVTG